MLRLSRVGVAALLASCIGVSSGLAADIPKPLPKIIVPVALPAVSAPNAKIDVFGGSIDREHGWGLDGSISLPLHQQWGLQVDGLGGSAGGQTFWGVGGHLFWRDPRTALFGVYGSWVDWSPVGAQVGKVGLEAEFYHANWTFSGLVAAQGGDFSGIAGHANIALYLHDNLKLDGGYRFLNGVGSIGDLGIEWQHDTSGLALFAKGSWGNNNYSTVIGGLRFYAGPPKSLIRRHREDDPANSLALDLFQNPPPANRCPVYTLTLKVAVCD